MKLLLHLLLLVSLQASAQTINTAIKYDKENKQGLMLYLPYSQEVAEGTILTKLKEIGFDPETKGSLLWKQNKVNGFYVFKGVSLQGASPQIVDLYFKVDRRGSKKDNQSVMYLLTSRGGENFITETSDAAAHTAAQNFLNSFTTETAAYKHTLDVQAQEEAIKKAEKRLSDLQNEEGEMTKRLNKLQDDLRKNKEAQESQKTTLEGERKKLEEMRAIKQ
jgi:murein L,D-transpeptidase YcbB/YkuD